MRRDAMPLLGLLLIATTACGGDDLAPRATDLDPDVPAVTEGSWYRPGVATSWQWQLTGSLDTAYDVEVYDVDLFDTSEADIAALHAAGRKVVCYFSAGSSENWRDDFSSFDARVLGEPLDGWDGERWLDIRTQNVVDVMSARLEVATQKGCDGVEPDNVDGYANDTGFEVSSRDQLAYNRFLANAAHARGLAVLLKNDTDQVASLVAYFDGGLVEECHRYSECDAYAAMTSAQKPIFNAEYAASLVAAESLAPSVCPAATAASLRTLILPVDLDDAFRLACDDWAP